MPTEIKCTQCGHWNLNKDYCESCENVLSLKEKQKQFAIDSKTHKSKQQQKKDDLEESLEYFKNHRYLLVRMCFHIIYSTVWVFWIISSVFSMIVAFLSA